MNLPAVTITKDTWWKIVDVIRAKDDKVPIWTCVQMYRICPASIVDPMSAELLSLYEACDGVSRITKPAEFYDLPALYVDAVRVIDAEIARMRKYEPET